MTSLTTEYIDRLVVGQLDVILGANISNIDVNSGGNLNIGLNAGNIHIGGANTSSVVLLGNLVGTTNPLFGLNLEGNISNISSGQVGISVFDGSNIVAGVFLGNCEGLPFGTLDAWLFEVPNGNVYGINLDVCIDSNVQFGHAIFTADATPADVPPTSTYGISAATFMSVHSGTLPDPLLYDRRVVISADPADLPGLTISEANVNGNVHEWQINTIPDNDHLDLAFRYDGNSCMIIHGGNCDVDFMGNVNIFGNINANIVPLLPDPLTVGNLIVLNNANVEGNLFITESTTGDLFALRAVPVSTYPDTMGGATFSEALLIVDQDGDILLEMYRDTNLVRFPTGTIIGTASGSLTLDLGGNLVIDSTANVIIAKPLFALSNVTVLGNLIAPNASFDSLTLGNLTVTNNTTLGSIDGSLTTIIGNLVALDQFGTQLLNVNPATGNIILGAPGSNVFVLGNLNWIESTNLQVTDNVILLNFSNSSVSAEGAGIQIQDGTTLDAAFLKVYTSTTPDEWHLGVPDGGIYRINQSLATNDNVEFANVVVGNLANPSYTDIMPGEIVVHSTTAGNISNVIISSIGDPTVQFASANLLGNVYTVNLFSNIEPSGIIDLNITSGSVINTIFHLGPAATTPLTMRALPFATSIVPANVVISDTGGNIGVVPYVNLNIAGSAGNLVILDGAGGFTSTNQPNIEGYNLIPTSGSAAAVTQPSYTRAFQSTASTAVASFITTNNDSYFVNLEIVGRSGTTSMINHQSYHINNTGGVITITLMEDNISPGSPFATISASSVGNTVNFTASAAANWSSTVTITLVPQ